MSESLSPGWVTTRLGDVGRWYGGGTPSKFEPRFWTKGTISWVSPKDMKSLRIVGSEDQITTTATTETNVKPFPEGTVLVVIRSGILSRTLPVGVASISATMNQDLKGVLPCEGIDSFFIAYQLIGREHEVLKKCSKHGTTVASIDTERLHDFPMRFAPLSEQRRIVAKIEELFSDLDAGVAALTRVKANLKRYRASVLKAAVEGRLTAEWRKAHPDVEPASKLLERILAERRAKWEAEQLQKFAEKGKEPPKGWREKYEEPAPTIAPPSSLPRGWTLATTEQLVAQSEYGTSVKCSYEVEGVPVLRIPNIARGLIDLSDLKFSTVVLQLDKGEELLCGDMLMCRTNGSIGLIGKAAVVSGDLGKPHTFASYLLRFRFVETRVVPWWVHLYATSRPGREFIESHAASSAGQHNISLSLMHSMLIPLPPLAEQAEIVAEVDRRLSVVDAAEAQVEHALQRAARLRQAILKRAFEGKLVPQDPSDEPAGVMLERIRATAQPARDSSTSGRRAQSKSRTRRDASQHVK